MSLHDPENFARIVRGMINIQKHEGELYAVFYLSLGSTRRQDGSPKHVRLGNLSRTFSKCSFQDLTIGCQIHPGRQQYV